MIDLDELERRAKAATPGRWKWDPDDGSFGSSQDDDSHYVTVAFGEPIGESNPGIRISDEDAAHIAACSPETILALVRVARASQTAADSLAAIVEVTRLRIESGLDPREQFMRAYDEILGVIETLAPETEAP